MTENPEEKVISAMERSADIYGVRKSYARLYGTLYFWDGDMTMEELSEETGYSRSTISPAMRKLEEFHMVSRSKKEGEGKKLFYTAEEDLEEAFKQLMNNQAKRELEVMQEALDNAEKELDEEEDKKTLEKVRNLKKTYRKSERFMKLVNSLPSGNYMEKLNSMLRRKKD